MIYIPTLLKSTIYRELPFTMIYNNFLKMYILRYEDDTVILSEHEHDFQSALNAYEHYCDNETNGKSLKNKNSYFQ